MSVAVAFAALQGSPSWFPANSALPYPWNRKETFMSKLASIALVVVVLISAGCSSIGMGGKTTTSSGDMSQLEQVSHYKGGRL
ncbi:hypothetical protein Bpro_2225 [Polaromonas sp. JS666]|nr:hypothetical protein Bpro_2225 [Polaromonas sp. JS666]